MGRPADCRVDAPASDVPRVARLAHLAAGDGHGGQAACLR